jgi:hypothetical protein
MKAARLIKHLQRLIEKHGNSDVKIIGVFTDGVHEKFTISHGSEYHDGSIFTGKKFDIQNCIIIDNQEV